KHECKGQNSLRLALRLCAFAREIIHWSFALFLSTVSRFRVGSRLRLCDRRRGTRDRVGNECEARRDSSARLARDSRCCLSHRPSATTLCPTRNVHRQTLVGPAQFRASSRYRGPSPAGPKPRTPNGTSPEGRSDSPPAQPETRAPLPETCPP